MLAEPANASVGAQVKCRSVPGVHARAEIGKTVKLWLHVLATESRLRLSDGEIAWLNPLPFHLASHRLPRLPRPLSIATTGTW